MANDFIPIHANYEDLPFYRKRWFVALTLLLFCPATIAIAASGDIYAKRQDGVYQYGPSGKKTVIVAACIFIVTGLARALS